MSFKDETLKDERYRINLEYCGIRTPQYVVRFVGYWVGSRTTKEKAEELAVTHNRIRLGV